MATAENPTLLEVQDLRCEIPTPGGTAYVLRGVDLDVPRGETLGIVGESGSGKSMLLKSALGLLPSRAEVRGSVTFDGADVLAMPPVERARFLGRRVGVVFQNPMTSLNPVVRIGVQMSEASRFHLGLSKKEARDLAADLLDQSQQQVDAQRHVRRLDDGGVGGGLGDGLLLGRADAGRADDQHRFRLGGQRGVADAGVRAGEIDHRVGLGEQLQLQLESTRRPARLRTPEALRRRRSGGVS